MSKFMALAVIAILAVGVSTSSYARGGHGGRVSYGGGHHTSSHGGTYIGGSGSSHRGGTYSSPTGTNQYGTHR